MYKMLLVDDEYLVRKGISETIDWNSYDIEIVATAVNGQDGLEKVETYHPDIIVSDIKMPVLDGMGLVSTLYDKNYDGIIIMLSGYNEFEYAKTTLEKGVFKYLLKPIDNDELVSVVVSAKEKLSKRRKMNMMLSDIDVGLPLIKNSITDSILHGAKADENFLSKMAIYDIPRLDKGVVIYCRADENTAGNDSVREENLKKSIEIVKNGTLSILQNHQVIYSQGEKRIAFATDFTDVDELEKRLNVMLRSYEKQSSVLLSVGISAVFNGFSEIPSAFGTAKFIAANKLYNVNSVYVEDKSKPNSKMYRRHIVDALQFIAEHYGDNDLKIKTVADALYVSESYLMHLFKEELGKTFNTCLTEYRIMTAKRLLLEQTYRIYEIAEMVGYVDMKYFGQVFRRSEGITPSEYVRKHNERKS